MDYKSIFTIMAGTLALAACTNDNAPQVEAETAARFFTNLEERVQTRMADDQWATDDAIGIFTLNDEQTGVILPDGTAAPSNLRLNMKYTRTAEGNWDSEDPFYFKNPASSDVQFAAYYPWTDDTQITDMAVQDGKIVGTITVNASDQSNQPAFDFLYADKASDQPDATVPTGNKNNPDVKFHFRHAMTKVVFKLVPDPAGSVTFSDIQGLVPTIKNFVPQGKFNLADGTISAESSAFFKNLTLSNKTEEANTSISYTAILPPQTTGSGNQAPEIILEGNSSYRSAKILSGKTLEAGKCYTVTINVKKITLEIESTEISNWTLEDGGSADAILQW